MQRKECFLQTVLIVIFNSLCFLVSAVPRHLQQSEAVSVCPTGTCVSGSCSLQNFQLQNQNQLHYQNQNQNQNQFENQIFYYNAVCGPYLCIRDEYLLDGGCDCPTDVGGICIDENPQILCRLFENQSPLGASGNWNCQTAPWPNANNNFGRISLPAQSGFLQPYTEFSGRFWKPFLSSAAAMRTYAPLSQPWIAYRGPPFFTDNLLPPASQQAPSQRGSLHCIGGFYKLPFLPAATSTQALARTIGACEPINSIAYGHVRIFGQSETTVNGDAAISANGEAAAAGTGPVTPGRLVLFECNAEHELIGQNFSVCLEDFSWLHQPPICQRKSCPEIPLGNAMNYVTHGAFPDSKGDLQVVPGTRVLLFCLEGYDLVGHDYNVCLYDLTWLFPSPPSCVAKSGELSTDVSSADYSNEVHHETSLLPGNNSKSSASIEEEDYEKTDCSHEHENIAAGSHNETSLSSLATFSTIATTEVSASANDGAEEELNRTTNTKTRH